MAKSFSRSYQYLGKLLYDERLKQGLSQRELEAKFYRMGIKIRQPQICKVEAGKKLYVTDLVTYAKGLEIDPCYLIQRLKEFMAEEAKE